MPKIELTEKQLSVLKDFIYNVDNQFSIDPYDSLMYFDNDVNFNCTKRELKSLQQAFNKIENTF